MSYKIQYRTYKYIITRLENVIEAVREDYEESGYIKPWLRGVADDLSELFPPEVHDDTREVLTLIENAESARDAINGAGKLKEFIIAHVEVFLKIDILFSRPQAAAFLLPVYYELKKDPRIISDCVARRYAGGIGRHYYDDTLEKLKEALEGKVEYCDCSQYHIQSELPDAVVFSDAFGGISRPMSLSISCVKGYVRRLIFVDYTICGLDVPALDPRNNVFPSVWLDCCISEFVWRMRHLTRGYDIKNSVITGHPVMDLTYNMYAAEAKPELPAQWRGLLEGKKVFLWNVSDFKMNDLKLMERILRDNPDIAIIGRPHPESLMTEYSRAISFMNELDSRFSNLIIDRFSDYSFSLSAADAYIGDAGSLYLQFAPSGRPMIILVGDLKNRSAIYSAYANIAKRERDVEEFISRVKQGYGLGTKLSGYYLGEVDGNVCKRIYRAIMNKFRAEENSFIKKYVHGFSAPEEK